MSQNLLSYGFKSDKTQRTFFKRTNQYVFTHCWIKGGSDIWGTKWTYISQEKVDDRGIDVVREQVKGFISAQSFMAS